MRATLHDLITAQRSRLHIPLHWKLKLQCMDFGGKINMRSIAHSNLCCSFRKELKTFEIQNVLFKNKLIQIVFTIKYGELHSTQLICTNGFKKNKVDLYTIECLVNGYL